MTELKPIEARILTVLIKEDRFLSTAEISTKAIISWNTAEKYLNGMLEKGWVERKGNKASFWMAHYDASRQTEDAKEYKAGAS